VRIRGQHCPDIAEILEKEGLIRSQKAFCPIAAKKGWISS